MLAVILVFGLVGSRINTGAASQRTDNNQTRLSTYEKPQISNLHNQIIDHSEKNGNEILHKTQNYLTKNDNHKFILSNAIFEEVVRSKRAQGSNHNVLQRSKRFKTGRRRKLKANRKHNKHRRRKSKMPHKDIKKRLLNAPRRKNMKKILKKNKNYFKPRNSYKSVSTRLSKDILKQDNKKNTEHSQNHKTQHKNRKHLTRYGNDKFIPANSTSKNASNKKNVQDRNYKLARKKPMSLNKGQNLKESVFKKQQLEMRNKNLADNQIERPIQRITDKQFKKTNLRRINGEKDGKDNFKRKRPYKSMHISENVPLQRNKETSKQMQRSGIINKVHQNLMKYKSNKLTKAKDTSEKASKKHVQVSNAKIAQKNSIFYGNKQQNPRQSVSNRQLITTSNENIAGTKGIQNNKSKQHVQNIPGKQRNRGNSKAEEKRRHGRKGGKNNSERRKLHKPLTTRINKKVLGQGNAKQNVVKKQNIKMRSQSFVHKKKRKYSNKIKQRPKTILRKNKHRLNSRNGHKNGFTHSRSSNSLTTRMNKGTQALENKKTSGLQQKPTGNRNTFTTTAVPSLWSLDQEKFTNGSIKQHNHYSNKEIYKETTSKVDDKVPKLLKSKKNGKNLTVPNIKNSNEYEDRSSMQNTKSITHSENKNKTLKTSVSSFESKGNRSNINEGNIKSNSKIHIETKIQNKMNDHFASNRKVIDRKLADDNNNTQEAIQPRQRIINSTKYITYTHDNEHMYNVLNKEEFRTIHSIEFYDNYYNLKTENMSYHKTSRHSNKDCKKCEDINDCNISPESNRDEHDTEPKEKSRAKLSNANERIEQSLHEILRVPYSEADYDTDLESHSDIPKFRRLNFEKLQEQNYEDNPNSVDDKCCDSHIIENLKYLYLASREYCYKKLNIYHVSRKVKQTKTPCVAECAALESGYLKDDAIVKDKFAEILKDGFRKMKWVLDVLDEILNTCVEKFEAYGKNIYLCRHTNIYDVGRCIGRKLQEECRNRHLPKNNKECDNALLDTSSKNCRPPLPGYGCEIS